MAKYRKTALIEATQFTPDVQPWPEGVIAAETSPTGYAIKTLENVATGQHVTPGDWIATGAQGERWPIKPDVFAATYERLRFRGNAIVRRLLDESTAGRRCSLNELAAHADGFSQADWEEFYQLIGYSIAGYHELSKVSDESALAASAAAKRIDPEAAGCRDTGCEMHCGVATEAAGRDRQDLDA